MSACSLSPHVHTVSALLVEVQLSSSDSMFAARVTNGGVAVHLTGTFSNIHRRTNDMVMYKLTFAVIEEII